MAICIAAGRVPFFFRAPVEVAEAQAARGLPRNTAPYIPRFVPPEEGGPIPPGPVEPAETPDESLNLIQRFAKALGKEEHGLDEVLKHIERVLPGAGSEAGWLHRLLFPHEIGMGKGENDKPQPCQCMMRDYSF